MQAKLIINPSAGRQNFEMKIDRLIYLMHRHNYNIDLSYTLGAGDAKNFAASAVKEGVDLIIVYGGDGTVNEVVQGMTLAKANIPLGILSAGTVNDFATYLRLPQNIDEFFQMIHKGKTLAVDLGKINDDVFINVAAGGLLTDIAYEVSDELKAVWGRMAYYIEGTKRIIGELTEPSKPFRLTVESEEFQGTVDAVVFMVTNSKSIGGMKLMAPEADVTDGLFDVIILKSLELLDLGPRIMIGGHINHKSVIYFKTKEMKISADKPLVIDIDGEKGDALPAKFSVLPKALKIFVPK